jgi:hypothetical protein
MFLPSFGDLLTYEDCKYVEFPTDGTNVKRKQNEKAITFNKCFKIRDLRSGCVYVICIYSVCVIIFTNLLSGT